MLTPVRRVLGCSAGAALVSIAAAAGLAAARRRFVVIRVAGMSMAPTYRPGDRVLIRRVAAPGLRRGQVVVFQNRHPALGWRGGPLPELDRTMWVIKRVAAVPGDPVPAEVAAGVRAAPGDLVPAGRLVVLGDGPVSRDSREWGYLPADRVLGVVVRRLS